MKRIMHIIRKEAALVAAVLLAALAGASCHDRTLERDGAELMVSLYIPAPTVTKADTGSVDPLDAETAIHTLQIWVFLHGGQGGKADGQLVSYREFTDRLSSTGLPNSTVTRFGMPLTSEMFGILSDDEARVDVFAVANASSAGVTPDETIDRSAIEALVIGESYFGSSLTTSVPDSGLPMSGVLKGAPVTGGYPVLNISTLTLTRAVSKIRFVFCQEGVPATGSDPAVPSNSACVIKGISFGGTAYGHDCQILENELLFTTAKYGDTDNLFSSPEYTYVPLGASLTGDPLLPNARIACAENPETLLFRSEGHESETAQEYEDRLDEALGSASQVGPIYLRETDKKISGTITYNTGGEDKTAEFSMNDGDIFARNHTWILYAYFAEETKTLRLKLVVLPWTKSTYSPIDFTEGTVNVVRRFTIAETDPATFRKVETSNGYDIYYWHTVTVKDDSNNDIEQENILAGDIIISTPVGAKLHIIPVPGTTGTGVTPYTGIFEVDHDWQTIYPNLVSNAGKMEDCKLTFRINVAEAYRASTYDDSLGGNCIDLYFAVEIGDELRWIDLGSESIDHYRIILKKDWAQE